MQSQSYSSWFTNRVSYFTICSKPCILLSFRSRAVTSSLSNEHCLNYSSTSQTKILCPLLTAFRSDCFGLMLNSNSIANTTFLELTKFEMSSPQSFLIDYSSNLNFLSCTSSSSSSSADYRFRPRFAVIVEVPISYSFRSPRLWSASTVTNP